MATIDGAICGLYSSSTGVKLRATYSTSTSAGKATVTVTKLECLCVGGQSVQHSYSYSFSLGGSSVSTGTGNSGYTSSGYTLWSGSYAKSVSQAGGGSVSVAISASDSFIYNGANKTASLSGTITVSGVPAVTYTVAYNANGGSGAPGNQTKTHGKTLTLSSTKPTKATTTATSTGTITVSYNANGGTGAPSASTGTYTKKTPTTYTFSKWNTNSSGTGTSYSSGGSYTANAAVTLYAIYTSKVGTATYTYPKITLSGTKPTKAATYTYPTGNITLTYNANGGTNPPTADVGTYTDKTTTTYTFSKWNSNAAGTGTDYSSSTGYTFSASTTLYAKYTSQAVTERQTNPTFTITSSEPTREGFNLLGWATDPDAVVPDYVAGDQETLSADTTLYAVWEQASKMYVGINGKAQKVTKAYIGVNGKAQEIKDAYIGINGKAQKIVF